MRRYLEARKLTLARLCQFDGLLAAMEAEERIAEAVFAMLTDLLDDRMSWGATIEFSEIRLGTIKLVYQLIARVGSSRDQHADQRFIASGLHRRLLDTIPMMRGDELEMAGEHLLAIFGHLGLAQEELVWWLRLNLGGKQKEVLEEGKDWALFVLGKLIMNIRHPKRHTFQSTVVTKALFGKSAAIPDKRAVELGQKWNSLFFHVILPLFKSPYLNAFLHPYKLAFAVLGQYSSLQATHELAWLHILAMAEGLIGSMEKVVSIPDTMVAQIDFLLGQFNYGGQAKIYWPRSFRACLALLPHQPAADEILAEVLHEQGLIQQAYQDVNTKGENEWVWVVLSGIVKWAGMRQEEGERWCEPEFLKRTHQAFLNEKIVVKTLALWTPILNAIKASEDTTNQLSGIKAKWEKMKASTALRSTLILPIDHAYVNLPSLRESGTSNHPLIHRRRSDGYKEPKKNDDPDKVEERSSEPLTTPSASQRRPFFHKFDKKPLEGPVPEKLPLALSSNIAWNDSPQQLIRDARVASRSGSNWVSFANTQSRHVLADISDIQTLPPKNQHGIIPLKESGKAPKRKLKSASTTENLPRSKTDVVVMRTEKSVEEEKAHAEARAKRHGRVARRSVSAFSLADEYVLEMALKQLSELDTSSSTWTSAQTLPMPERRANSLPTKEAKKRYAKPPSSHRSLGGPITAKSGKKMSAIMRSESGTTSSGEMPGKLVSPREAAMVNMSPGSSIPEVSSSLENSERPHHRPSEHHRLSISPTTSLHHHQQQERRKTKKRPTSRGQKPEESTSACGTPTPSRVNSGGNLSSGESPPPGRVGKTLPKSSSGGKTSISKTPSLEKKKAAAKRPDSGGSREKVSYHSEGSSVKSSHQSNPRPRKTIPKLSIPPSSIDLNAALQQLIDAAADDSRTLPSPTPNPISSPKTPLLPTQNIESIMQQLMDDIKYSEEASPKASPHTPSIRKSRQSVRSQSKSQWGGHESVESLIESLIEDRVLPPAPKTPKLEKDLDHESMTPRLRSSRLKKKTTVSDQASSAESPRPKTPRSKLSKRNLVEEKSKEQPDHAASTESPRSKSPRRKHIRTRSVVDHSSSTVEYVSSAEPPPPRKASSSPRNHDKTKKHHTRTPNTASPSTSDKK